MATQQAEKEARKAAKAVRRNARRRQDRLDRPPTEREAAYDRGFDAWLAHVGGGRAEVDRGSLRQIYARARRVRSEQQRYRRRVEEAAAPEAAQLHGALEDTIGEDVGVASPLPSAPLASLGPVVMAEAAAAAAGVEPEAVVEGVEAPGAAVGEVAVEADAGARTNAVPAAEALLLLVGGGAEEGTDGSSLNDEDGGVEQEEEEEGGEESAAVPTEVLANGRLLAAEPEGRWPHAGALRFALPATSARDLLTYVRVNRNARTGQLPLGGGCGSSTPVPVLGGYNNYRRTHQVEEGGRHRPAEQAKHTLLLTCEELQLACRWLPGLDALVQGGLRLLPEAQVEGHVLVPLHGHILNQASPSTCFADHQDTEEEVPEGAVDPDRRIVYTLVIALSDGCESSLRILGQEELAFERTAGSGMAFRSALWHRTERAGAGVWKLALFYGYLL